MTVMWVSLNNLSSEEKVYIHILKSLSFAGRKFTVLYLFIYFL